MIVTQLEQEEYNVGENCSAIANVDLTMKKKKLQKKKFSKQINFFLVYTTVKKKLLSFKIGIMGKIVLAVLE